MNIFKATNVTAVVDPIEPAKASFILNCLWHEIDWFIYILIINCKLIIILFIFSIIIISFYLFIYLFFGILACLTFILFASLGFKLYSTARHWNKIDGGAHHSQACRPLRYFFIF